MLASSIGLPRKDPMRRIPLTRTITAIAAAALLVPSMAAAQEELRDPAEFGESLGSAVVTSALDPSFVNVGVVEVARTVHEQRGGLTSGRRNGWTESGPMPDTEAVSAEVLALANNNEDPLNVITVMGGDNQHNVNVARSFPATQILDVGQTLPCVTEQGAPDPTGECAGGEFAVPLNYSAIDFAVEEGAYLAGVVAAKAGIGLGGGLGVISGLADCTECQRYVTGFTRGARSVDPEIDIEVAYLSTPEEEAAGFSNPETARTFARAFIDVYEPAVLMAVGRAATRGMVEAACEAGIRAVATGIDIRASYPELDCTLASVTTDVERAVRDQLIASSYGDAQRVVRYGLQGDGVSVSDEWTDVAFLPVDTAEAYEAAQVALLAGRIEACDESCDLGPVTATAVE